jgi:polyketide biosynthesis enoyl-CoA hydratase PksI
MDIVDAYLTNFSSTASMTNTTVAISEIRAGIVQITLADRVNKNTFSRELVKDLHLAFQRIRDHAHYKVVILTGYDTYFASGGTQEGLLAIHEKEEKFTDNNLYSLALECDIPVIAAMQGHAIGGGFVFGMFADFVIFSRESIYTTNFMKYGFTPGMGGTFILPQKLGASLAMELLFTAENYHGADLEKRNIPFPVLPRAEVLAYARRLAEQIAEKPRISLVTLKSHMVAGYREQLPVYIQKELEMHDKTFHLPEVRERILTLFGK